MKKKTYLTIITNVQFLNLMQKYGGFGRFPNILARSSSSCCDGVGSRRQEVTKGQNLVVSKEIFPIILWYRCHRGASAARGVGQD